MQSVMTRTATLRAPSGSMTDVFACTRAQIYYNSKRKPLAQVKRESGCSHIINGYLFNGSFQPVGWTVIDGKVISRDAYQDWGISIGSDGKPQMLTDRGGSFLSGVPLLKNGAKLERSLTPDVARSAARTAVGWMPDGRIRLWCDKTGLTREQLDARGMNHSSLHEDVMIGAEDSEITGKCRDGRTVQLFQNGVWVL